MDRKRYNFPSMLNLPLICLTLNSKIWVYCLFKLSEIYDACLEYWNAYKKVRVKLFFAEFAKKAKELRT